MEKYNRRRSLRIKMMVINVAITLASFLLCGSLFVMAVQILLGRYVNHDLDFFLTETGSNLEHRLGYMEDVVFRVRSSAEMMEYLDNTGNSEDTLYEYADEVFQKIADISHPKNQGDGSGPVVEKVYLFRDDGSCVSAFYYAMLYSEIDESDKAMRDVWQQYRRDREGQKGFHGISRMEETGGYLAYPVLDEFMQAKGVLVYEINLKAIENTMREVESYKGAFWNLCDQDSFISGHDDQDIRPYIADIKKTQEASPYIRMVDGMNYRLLSRSLCMNLHITLGIPENQALMVLYDSMNIYIVGIVATLFAGIISFAIFTFKVTQPVEEVTRKLKQVQEGNFETKLPDYDSTEFHEIATVFNEMTEYINHLVNQVYEKQIAVKELELKFLQTQMNPHFMFNVLNSLALQAKIDGNEEVSRLISTFSQLIQAKIYRDDSEKVQICQELEYVKYYLTIQKFRYGERLSYEVEVGEESLLDLYIPKLCVQILVENAVVHGLEPKLGSGSVCLGISRDRDDVMIEIRDDGVGFDTEGKITLPLTLPDSDNSHNHVGLNNIHNIIRLMYGKEYGIEIESRKNYGTCAYVRLPVDRGVSGIL